MKTSTCIGSILKQNCSVTWIFTKEILNQYYVGIIQAELLQPSLSQ